MEVNDVVEIPQMSAAINGADGQLAMITPKGTIIAIPQTPNSTIYVVDMEGCEMEFDMTELRVIREMVN